MGWTSILLGVEGVPIAGLSDERGLTDKFHGVWSKATSKEWGEWEMMGELLLA
jgi:hypothetical protein